MIAGHISWWYSEPGKKVGAARRLTGIPRKEKYPPGPTRASSGTAYRQQPVKPS